MSELRRAIRNTLMPGFAGLEPPSWVFDAISGGVHSWCVYGENVQDQPQLAALSAALRSASSDLMIAIDEEGGEVTRLHYREGSPYPGAAVLGRIDDVDVTKRVGARVGRELLSSGFALALGPVADVNSDPRNPVIGTRSFGADADLVSRHVSAWIRGLRGTGAAACAKHFPGHGATALDSHLHLPTVDAEAGLLAERDLPPFAAAIAAEVDAIMTSHILLPEVDAEFPATFSAHILQGILREQLGFTGVIVSDALDMRGASAEIGIPEAAVRALAAGCDLLCLGTGSSPELLAEIEERVIAAVSDGRLAADRLHRAAERVDELRARTARGVADAGSTDAGFVPEAEPTAPAELERIAASFAGTEAAARWAAAHPRARLLRVESSASQAVGAAPWGPPASPGDFIVTAETPMPWSRALPPGVSPADGVIIVGRDLHRHEFSRDGIASLRDEGVPTLIVEMGWPDPEWRADLETSGSTLRVGEAVRHLLTGGTR